MSIVRTQELKKYYGEGENLTKALDGVDISIGQGEFIAIVGTSGSGKSTLLHMLGGLDTPTSGLVEVNGQNLAALPPDKLTVFRRRQIGFVFQSYNLVPILNVYENIVLPVELDGVKIDRAYVDSLISLLGLEQKVNNLPGSLSGGQQQRVAIARALAAKPSIILADEPTGNLDSHTSREVLQLLKSTAARFGQTVVMITHNDELAQLAGRVIRIEDGRVKVSAYSGNPAAYTQPTPNWAADISPEPVGQAPIQEEAPLPTEKKKPFHRGFPKPTTKREGKPKPQWFGIRRAAKKPEPVQPQPEAASPQDSAEKKLFRQYISKAQDSANKRRGNTVKSRIVGAQKDKAAEPAKHSICFGWKSKGAWRI